MRRSPCGLAEARLAPICGLPPAPLAALIRAAGEMPASPEDDFQQRAEITSILTPEEYEILRKLYLEKYTYEELAREMGLKKSALAMRVKRSKERFVKQWNRH